MTEREILTSEAKAFITRLHRTFDKRRKALLSDRKCRQKEFDAGKLPDFLKATESVRTSEWQIAPVPEDLEDRRVEITGPVDAKMMINALNSGANVYMADFEDSLSPRWDKVITGQKNLIDAVRKRLEFVSPDGKRYELNEKIATLLVRPRGWHLDEKHFCVDGKPVSASLFDFGLYFFHNVEERLKQRTAPYFYLPKLESHLEARLWNDVFSFSEETFKVPRGTLKATVLIETIVAAFEMDEILYELKDHIVGLNAGRWDYLFSIIKKFRNQKDFIFPDRARLTMTLPFMRAYTNLLVQTCHKRGAHAIGGMSAFVPNRKDPAVNERAFAAVRSDKEREARDGFDGTWVAHPDLVPVAREAFDKILGKKQNKKDKLREDIKVKSHDLLNFKIPEGAVTEEGIRNNISVSLQYLHQWLNGVGASVIFNLMEDVATAEIARAQLWQWLRYRAILKDGRKFTREIYEQIRGAVILKSQAIFLEENGAQYKYETNHLTEMVCQPFKKAIHLLNELTLNDNFHEFLTIPAYDYLDKGNPERGIEDDRGVEKGRGKTKPRVERESALAGD